MKFNYQTEKNKLDRAWGKLEVDYRSAGMTEAAIEEMRAFDYEQFRKERTYCNHNDYFDFSVVDADVEEGNAETLMFSKHIEAFSTEMNLMESDDRYAWIDLLDNQELCGEIKKLKLKILNFLLCLQ